MPPVDKDALVVLATDGPMSYVLPAFPPDARFLGINNSISDARRKTLMEETIARTIREHRGPIYEMSYPWGTGVDALLERQLRRLPDRCAPIVTNMRTSPIEFCRVERMADNGPRTRREGGGPVVASGSRPSRCREHVAAGVPGKRDARAGDRSALLRIDAVAALARRVSKRVE